MPAPFPPWSNTAARLTASLILLSPVVGLAALMLYQRTSFITGQFVPVGQPVPFDHRHHAADEGIDCRYCHQSATFAPSAGIPPTQLCMNCHSQIWNRSPLLGTVRQSYFEDRAIAWNRVHDLPDFVYFNHSIHVNKGVGCVSCHGRVDRMALVEQSVPLTMGWCLDCHREPTRFLQPKSQITDMAFVPQARATPEQIILAREYDVKPRQNCTTCHR